MGGLHAYRSEGSGISARCRGSTSIKRRRSTPKEREGSQVAQTEAAWRARAAQLAQEAQEHLANGNIEEAKALVDSALALIESEGSEEDIVFACVLLVFADMRLDIEEYESAASVYKRSSEVAHALIDGVAKGTEGDVIDVLARSYLGLARADVGRQYNERAKERYQTALQYMKDCTLAWPVEVFDQVRGEIFSLA